MLRITDAVSIADWELTEQFTRASGPGGQNVNKVSSAVELRFEAERSEKDQADAGLETKTPRREDAARRGQGAQAGARVG